MIFKGTMIGPASGKMNGVVFSRNRGGQYVRKLAIPSNPQTPFQTDVRNAMSNLAVRWNTVLTNVQRQAWQTYANNVTWINRLGDAIQVSGINAYCNSNVSRVQASLTVVDAAPVIYNRGDFTLPVPTITAGSTSLSLAFTNTDDWATEVGSALLVYAGRPVSETVNFFKGPYQFVGKVAGAVSPPASPATLTLPWPAGATGSRLYFRFLVSRVDGRLSPAFPVQAVV